MNEYVVVDWVRVSTYNKQNIEAGILGSSTDFMMDMKYKNVNWDNINVYLVDDSIGQGRSMNKLIDLLKIKW